MQGNNYGLLVKTIKKFPKSPFRPAGRVLMHFWQNQICTLKHREFVMFRFYFPLFIKVFMVLLLVIFNSEWHLRAAFWVLLHRGWKLNNWNTIIHYSLIFFSRLFAIHFKFFRDIHYSFFSFYVSFPFQIPFLWITCKEVTTVILDNFWLYHKRRAESYCKNEVETLRVNNIRNIF